MTTLTLAAVAALLFLVNIVLPILHFTFGVRSNVPANRSRSLLLLVATILIVDGAFLGWIIVLFFSAR